MKSSLRNVNRYSTASIHEMKIAILNVFAIFRHFSPSEQTKVWNQVIRTMFAPEAFVYTEVFCGH